MPPVPEPLLDDDELDLRDYIGVVRRRKLVIVVTVVVVVAAALAFSFLQTPSYRASAEVLLADRASDEVLNPDAGGGNANDEQQRVQTEIEVMKSRSVRDAVVDELGYEPDVSISANGETSVVSISATDTDRDRAVTEANIYAATYIDVRRAANIVDLTESAGVLEAQIAEIDGQVAALDAVVADLDARINQAPDDLTRAQLQAERDRAQADADSRRISLQTQRQGYVEQLGDLQIATNSARTGGGQVVSDAERPSSPVSPDPVRNAAVALVLGLILGIALAFLRDYLDDTLRSKDDLDRISGGREVLGLIPAVVEWSDRAEPQLISLTSPNSPAAEAYRGLRTSVQFLAIDRPLTVVQITSSSATEGKTTTLANLGVALSRAGKRVVLVDLDLRRPRLHQFFGLDNTVGFTSVLLGEDEVGRALQAVPDVPRLAILASGPPPPNPSELLSTTMARDLLRNLAEHADYVLVDCPPLLPVADSVVLAGYADATVLVATVEITDKRSLRRSLELLHQVNAPLSGLILNGLEAQAAYAYGYGGDGGLAQTYAERGERTGRGRRKGGGSAGEVSSAEAAATARLPGEGTESTPDPARNGNGDRPDPGADEVEQPAERSRR